jgi:hypothetical protein
LCLVFLTRSMPGFGAGTFPLWAIGVAVVECITLQMMTVN